MQGIKEIASKTTIVISEKGVKYQKYSETSLIRHSMGPENNVGLGGCWIMECLLLYLCMVIVPHIMVGLERMLDYTGVGLETFHCTSVHTVVNVRTSIHPYESTLCMYIRTYVHIIFNCGMHSRYIRT